MDVKHVDWTAMIELLEITEEAKECNVYFVMVNVTSYVKQKLLKFGIVSRLPDDNSLNKYLTGFSELQCTPLKTAYALSNTSSNATETDDVPRIAMDMLEHNAIELQVNDYIKLKNTDV